MESQQGSVGWSQFMDEIQHAVPQTEDFLRHIFPQRHPHAQFPACRGVIGSVWTPCVLPRIMISVIMETPSPLLTMRITVSSST